MDWIYITLFKELKHFTLNSLFTHAVGGETQLPRGRVTFIRDFNHQPLSYWTPSSTPSAGRLLTCEAMYFSSGLSIRPMCSVAMLGGCSSVGESSLSSSFPLKLCTTHTTYTHTPREVGREAGREGDRGDLINTQMEMSLQLNYGHTHTHSGNGSLMQMCVQLNSRH